jgi:hypothetical protein
MSELWRVPLTLATFAIFAHCYELYIIKGEIGIDNFCKNAALTYIIQFVALLSR